MRVIYWMETCLPLVGGREILTARMMDSLREHGHEFVVISCLTDAKQPEYEISEALGGVPVYRFNFYDVLGKRSIDFLVERRAEMAQLVSDLGADLIHMHDVGGSVLSLPRTLPILLTMHYVPVYADREKCGMLFRGLQIADHVAAVSSAVRDRLCELRPEIAGRCSVVHNGLPEPGVEPAPLPWDPPTLLCLGRLVELKGFDLAIEAVRRLRPSVSDLRMLIVGEGAAGEDLRAQAREACVDDAVEFLGQVPAADVPGVINQSTITLLPSRPQHLWMEGLPLVAIQAMQMARPIVGTRCGGIVEAVAEGETGLLADIDDVDALTAAIGELLSDRGRAAAMGRAGRRRVDEVFAWQNGLVSNHNDLYHQLVTSKANNRSNRVR